MKASATRRSSSQQNEKRTTELKGQPTEMSGQRKGKKQQLEQPYCASPQSLTDAINEYLQEHHADKHSKKTIEWHSTALSLLRHFLAEERNITLVSEVDAPSLEAWLTALRKVPGKRGKRRSERTVQTYARSARAFFSWLVRQEMIAHNPFGQVAFPKIGRPRIQTIEPEEFEQLLQACALPHESGQFAERAVARNHAIFWLLYETGIRVSELCELHVGSFDRRHGILTVKGDGSRERRIAMGASCVRSLLHYVDRHRPDEAELEEWGHAGEEHLFLSEMRTALTKDGIEMLFKRVRERAGIVGKRISPHMLRHTFALRYLSLGNDPFSLQELLGHRDPSMVKQYMRMHDEMLHSQKRALSPGDHVPARMQGAMHARRIGFQVKTRGKGTGV